eukprot:2189507-Prymnesium_polylepis.3
MRGFGTIPAGACENQIKDVVFIISASLPAGMNISLPAGISGDDKMYTACGCSCSSNGHVMPQSLASTNTLAALRHCCIGHTVRIALAPFDTPPLFLFNDTTGKYSGYLPSMIDLFAAEMGFVPQLVPLSRGGAHWTLLTDGPANPYTLDSLPGGSIDAVVLSSDEMLKAIGGNGCSLNPGWECWYDKASQDTLDPRYAFRSDACPLHRRRHTTLSPWAHRPSR